MIWENQIHQCLIKTFKFKFIAFAKINIKFIDFVKVEFKFINNSWADSNSTSIQLYCTACILWYWVMDKFISYPIVNFWAKQSLTLKWDRAPFSEKSSPCVNKNYYTKCTFTKPDAYAGFSLSAWTDTHRSWRSAFV